MRTILNLIDEPDVVPLLVLIGLLAAIGSLMVASWPNLKKRGDWIGCGAMVLYCAYAAIRSVPDGAADALWIVVRGLLALGLVRGIAWVGLSVGAFVADASRRLRRYVESTAPRTEPALVLPALVRPATVVEVIDSNATGEAEERKVVRRVRRERAEYEDRLHALEELREVGGLDEEMIEELRMKELERYLRKVTDVLGYQ